MNSIVKFDKQLNNLARLAKKKAPTILTVLGITGFVSSTIMAVKVTPKAMEVLDEVEKELPEEMPAGKKILCKAKAVAPLYAPSILMGLSAGYCVAKANKVNGERLGQVITACEVKDKVITEYQNKVIETIGEKKEREIRDEIAKDHVAQAPEPTDSDILNVSTGTQLFLDSVTGQYFRSTRDDIYKAQIEFQRRLFIEGFMTHSEWLSFIDGVNDNSRLGSRIGYNAERGIDILLSVAEAPNGEPVTVIEYRTEPTYDFCIANNW